MGLDIYIHRTRHQMYNEDYSDVINETETDSRSKLAAKYAECVAKLAAANGTPEYDEIAIACVKELAELFSYPEFDLNKLGYGKKFVEFDQPDDIGRWGEWQEVITAAPLENWLKNAERIIRHHYDKSVGYFRKVNLLFAYCQNRGILLDEYFAYITKAEALDIIDRCKKVLADHSLAGELLPTQSGCFFGSTDYDDWYYKDVESVLKTFEGLLPTYDEPAYPEYQDDSNLGKIRCALYIIFSW